MEQCHKAKNAIRSILFWRRYSSDLQRCQNTTKRILGISSSYPSENGENNNDNMVNYELDQRLRERAKGAREGKDKSLTYDEALIKWHLEQQLNNKNIVNIIPLLEMEQDVWKRAQDWIQDVVHLAYNNYSELIHHDENDEKNHHWNQQTRKISNDQKQQKQLIQHEIDDNGMFIFHVLAVTHSGTLRIMINEMVGEQLPTIGTKTTTTDKDGVKIKQLEIPNTSITAIDIIPIDCSSSRRSSIKDYDEADRYNGITHNNNLVDDEDDDINEQSSSITWTSKLIELTNIDHLKGHYNIDRN
jgi:broad specificity phosphatase PhoE